VGGVAVHRDDAIAIPEAVMIQTDIDLRQTLDLLRRRWRLIAITVVSVLALAVLATYMLKPIFTASSLVLVDPSRKNLLNPDSQAASGSSDSARVDSEVEIVVSDSNLLRLIEELDLVSDPELGVRLGLMRRLLAWLRMGDGELPRGEEALAEVLSNVRRAVSARRVGLTFLIDVSAQSEDRSKAAQLANAASQAYIRSQIDAKVGSILEARDVLGARIADASVAIVKTEGAFDDFVANNIDAIVSGTGRTDIALLRQRLTSTESERVRLSGLAEEIERQVAGGSWSSLADSLGSQAMRELERQRQQVLDEIADQPQQAPAVDLRARLAEIESKLEAEGRQGLASLQRSLSDSQVAVTDLRQSLRSSVLNAELPTDILARVYEIQQASEIARSQYQTLLARLNDLETQAALQLADSRIVSQALPPSRPSFPNTTLILALAGLGALGFGVLFAMLYDNYLGGFTSEGQVESVLHTKVVASIPRQRALRDTKSADASDTLADTMIDAPLSAYAEAIRSIRVAVEQNFRRSRPGAVGHKAPVIMICSAAPNEGKTTVALSLARAYAQAGQRTLLVDCDLRKPNLHRQLGLEPTTAIADWLFTREPIQDLHALAQKDPATQLRVVLGARRANQPTDHLIVEPSFQHFVEVARNSFDVVVLDTPPIGPVVDALWIAPMADVVVFVVRWSATTQQDAAGAIERLRSGKRADADLLTVLNQIENIPGSRGKYSGYYDAY
jgi:succinoglycan biosynthesis transport protein ExoP